MDRIFTVDTLQTQHVLELICRDLSLRDLVKFEEVTPQTKEAVRDHQYGEKIVYLGTYNENLSRRLVADDGSQLSGPIITRPAISLNLSGQNIVPKRCSKQTQPKPYDWDWLLATLVYRAPHIRNLELFLKYKPAEPSDGPSSQWISSCLWFKLNRRADAALAGLTFSQCAVLKLEFNIQITELIAAYIGVLPNLLRHFPALEHLALHGYLLPLVSTLPAPHKLKSLRLDFYNTTGRKFTPTIRPVVKNFSGLESFSVSLNKSSHRYFNVMQWGDYFIESLDPLNRLNILTGINWVASFQTHPPVRMHSIQLPSLADWSLPLLVACSSASPTACSSLTIDYIDCRIKSTLAEQRNGPIGQYLQRLTRLTGSFTVDELINEFLACTPSLTCLVIDSRFSAITDWFDVKHPLHRLRVLVVYETDGNRMWGTGWIRPVKRNAPPGLKVVIKNVDKQRKDDRDVAEGEMRPAGRKRFWRRVLTLFRSTS